MHRKTAQALAVVALATLPMFASAQLTANVALTSNYKFRGQDQDTGRTRAFKPAIQGGFDYAFGETGWYVGNWNSSVNWLPGNSIESDLYGGYKFTAGGVAWDVGALTYIYPGAKQGDTTELYGAGTYGPLTLKYSHTISKDYFGWAQESSGSGYKGRNTGYLNLAFAQEVAPSLTLKAAVGYTRFNGGIKDYTELSGAKIPNYVDYALGVSYDFGSGVALYGGVQGANKKDYFGFVNKARAIVTLSKTL
ncbi:TorF family putative porin [Variovorax sp. N23]|uniref:TorF family putative porin n=1 Tax=Variovorax sp. N23 TaxID=2980555 RepID=UPI0021C6A9A7|nr:TorF family putative porin [Variovorax sp. N23]MCU4120521.1 TorF family putative porin [Variovorax sp. N23]